MKKVLIITYYWPPCKESRTLRWLYFTKYLSQYGWQPMVLTFKHNVHTVADEYLQRQINTEFIEIPLNSKVSNWLKKDNPAKMPWYLINTSGTKEINKVLKSYLKKHRADIVVSSGPPHALHRLGYKLKKQKGVYWVADLSSIWKNTGTCDGHKELSIDLKIIQHCNLAICGSETIKAELESLCKCETINITNGFDYVPLIKETDKKFTIVHLGNMPRNRNPINLWKALGKLCRENETFCNDLQIELVGKIDEEIVADIEAQGLLHCLTISPFLRYTHTIERQFKAQVLLLIVNRTKDAMGIIPNKVFEYLAASRPILGIGPVGGDAAQIIQQTYAGRMFNYKEYRELKAQIAQWYSDYKNKELVIRASGVKKYSCRSLTKQLVKSFEKLGFL